MSDKQIVSIISAPYDLTSSFRNGADRGPAAILACYSEQIERYERFSETIPDDILDIRILSPLQIKQAIPEDMVSNVSESVSAALEDGVFMLLGGEHSVSIGAFEALKDAGKEKDITIIHIDAHADLRDDDSDYAEHPSRLAHSCVMRRAHELGFKIVSIGVRNFALCEKEYWQTENIPVFLWPQDENQSLFDSILKKCTTKEVYISLDVDGIDPAHMPATGTPVQGGLSWRFAIDLLQSICSAKTVVGVDIVEVCPIQSDSLTEFGAAQIMQLMLGFWAKKTQ